MRWLLSRDPFTFQAFVTGVLGWKTWRECLSCGSRSIWLIDPGRLRRGLLGPRVVPAFALWFGGRYS